MQPCSHAVIVLIKCMVRRAYFKICFYYSRNKRAFPNTSELAGFSAVGMYVDDGPMVAEFCSFRFDALLSDGCGV